MNIEIASVTRFARTEQFSPDMGAAHLYMRFNSANDEEADAANEEWEVAIEQYQRHVDNLHDWMPAQLRKLAHMCLHDAELLACDEVVERLFLVDWPLYPLWSNVAIVSIAKEETFINLIYVLRDHIRKSEPSEEWPFSEERTHWLYDEIDESPDENGQFLHRSLFSDGTIIEIPLSFVLIHSFPIKLPAPV